jgi:hypothetical protein
MSRDSNSKLRSIFALTKNSILKHLPHSLPKDTRALSATPPPVAETQLQAFCATSAAAGASTHIQPSLHIQRSVANLKHKPPAATTQNVIDFQEGPSRLEALIAQVSGIQEIIQILV